MKYDTSSQEGLNALVVEGGAMRGIFAAGVLDAFLKENFNPFDMCIGVSAGATNLSGYLAKMYKRNCKIIMNYSTRQEFIDIKRFLKGGDLLDLDWLWDVSLTEIGLNIGEIINYQGNYLVGVTNAQTGKPEYFQPDRENLNHILKASSAIPILYKEVIQINGTDYVDGGVADPIPVKEAYKRNAKNILVIRSRPFNYKMKNRRSKALSKLVLKEYPNLIDTVYKRAKIYNETIDFIRNSPSDINILEVNPPDDFKTTRLTTDKNILKEDYNKGFEIGIDTIKNWNNLISSYKI